MTRLADAEETRREQLENAMACNARILKAIEVMWLCINQGSPSSLTLAQKELAVVQEKTNKAQRELSKLWNLDYGK